MPGALTRSPAHFLLVPPSSPILQPHSLLLPILLLFVANENEDCSAVTNEIIVTMHTFQDVSCAEA